MRTSIALIGYGGVILVFFCLVKGKVSFFVFFIYEIDFPRYREAWKNGVDCWIRHMLEWSKRGDALWVSYPERFAVTENANGKYSLQRVIRSDCGFIEDMPTLGEFTHRKDAQRYADQLAMDWA